MNGLSRGRQSGITLSGMLFVSALLVIVILVFLKMFPLLNEWMKVKNTLQFVANQPGVSEKSKAEIYDLIVRNLEVNDVDSFHERNIGSVTKLLRDRSSGKKVLRMKYEKRGPLYGPFDLVLNIDESVTLP